MSPNGLEASPQSDPMVASVSLPVCGPIGTVSTRPSPTILRSAFPESRATAKHSLVVEGGYELVPPRVRRTVVDKDVKSAILPNLHQRRKRLQPAYARTPLTADEHSVATAHWNTAEGIPVPFFRMPCY